MEEASCRSFCPLEAAEAPSLPAALGIVWPLPPKLRTEMNIQHHSRFKLTLKDETQSKIPNDFLQLDWTRCTFLIGGINSFPHLFFAVGIHIHIREDPGLVGPQIVVGAKEVNRKLPDIVPHPLDVLWDSFGMADLCWPPPLQSRRGNKH